MQTESVAEGELEGQQRDTMIKERETVTSDMEQFRQEQGKGKDGVKKKVRIGEV